jgi:hypothetical protein
MAQINIANQFGIVLYDSIASVSAIQQLEAKDAKLRHVMAAVETEDLGLSGRDGDIDIVGYPGTPQEELLQYRGLGVAWVVLGVVVVFGAVAFGIHFFTESTKIAKRNKLLEQRNNTLLTGQALTDWQAYRNSDEYTDTQSLYESAMESADDAWDLIKKGLPWGVAIAIPLLVWILLKK